MNPDEKEMLRKTLEFAQDNNRLLHSIKRGLFWSKIFRIIYWVIIIGAAIGILYYIQPYIDQVVGAYGNVKGNLQDFGNLLK